MRLRVSAIGSDTLNPHNRVDKIKVLSELKSEKQSTRERERERLLTGEDGYGGHQRLCLTFFKTQKFAKFVSLTFRVQFNLCSVIR